MTQKMSRSSFGQRVEQRGHGGLAVGRLDHRAQLDRFGQRQLLGEHAVAHRRVDLLEVDVGDPIREPFDDLHVVAVAVGDVAGVEAEVHVLRVGVGQEPLDPLLGVDVRVDVRVEHQLDAELLEQVAGQLVGARAPGWSSRPGPGRRLRWPRRCACRCTAWAGGPGTWRRPRAAGALRGRTPPWPCRAPPCPGAGWRTPCRRTPSDPRWSSSSRSWAGSCGRKPCGPSSVQT